MHRNTVVSVLLVVAVAAMGRTAFAASTENHSLSAQRALQMASEYSFLSISAHDLKTSRGHLHHILDCLEGRHGKDYDAKTFDPCKSIGYALPNVPAGSRAATLTHEAAMLGAIGVHIDNLGAVHHIVEAMQALTKSAKNILSKQQRIREVAARKAHAKK